MLRISKPPKPTATICVPVDEYRELLKAANKHVTMLQFCPECRKNEDSHSSDCVLGRALGHKTD